MSQSDTPFARMVGALKYISLGRDRLLTPPVSGPAQYSQVPGGPFVSPPGPAKLTLGKSPAPLQAILDDNEQVTLIGANAFGAEALQNSLIAQQIARNGAYVLLDFKLDHDRRDMFAHLHREAKTLANFRILNVDNPSQSHSYNPLVHGTANRVATRVVAALMDSSYLVARMTEAEFSAAVDALAVLIQALRDRDGVAQFKGLHEALETEAGFQALVQNSRIHPATRAELAAQFTGSRTQDGQHYDLDRVREPLARILRLLPSFATGKLGQVLNATKPEIDVLDGLSTRQGLFMMLPVMGKDFVAVALGRLVMAELADALEDPLSHARGPDQPPALIVTTETALLAQGNILQTIAAAKEARVNVVASVSSTRSLENLSQMDRDALLHNGATKVFFQTKESPEVLRAFGESLAQAGASNAMPGLMASLDKAPPGEGFISRGFDNTHLVVWPNSTVPGSLDSYQVSQGQSVASSTSPDAPTDASTQ